MASGALFRKDPQGLVPPPPPSSKLISPGLMTSPVFTGIQKRTTERLERFGSELCAWEYKRS